MLLGHPIKCETRTTGGGGGWHNTPPSIARREGRAEVVVGATHPHRMQDVKDGREGGGWSNTPPSNARREGRAEAVVGATHPHRSRDAKDRRRWWLTQYTPIDRKMRTTGGGGDCPRTPPSIARREGQAEVVAAQGHPHRLQDAKDGQRWWLPKDTPIDHET